jgi:hypothetical protein
MAERAVRKTAYDVLGITHDAVLRAPQITHQLRLMSARVHSEINTPRDPYYFLNASDDPDARRILDAYYSVALCHRARVPLEAFCVAAGVPTLRALDLITIAMVRAGAQASTVVGAMCMPSVVEKMVERALDDTRDDATENATLLAKATGFLPSPRGNHTQINVSASAKSDALAAATAAQQTVIVVAPSPEQTIRRAVDRFNERAAVALPASVPAALPESSAVAMPSADLRMRDREAITIELDDPADDDEDDADDV